MVEDARADHEYAAELLLAFARGQDAHPPSSFEHSESAPMAGALLLSETLVLLHGFLTALNQPAPK